MRKSKFRLYGISALICTIPLLCSCLAERNFVEMLDDYFTGDINPGNQSAVYLNQSGNDGFGFFFLGDNTIEGEYKLQINNIGEDKTRGLTCKKQLKGYYTNNFINFGMFPIDLRTSKRFENNGARYITGGLYTDCYDQTQNYSGVYGYIKREYQSSGTKGIKNSHEIWAGIELENRQRKFQENSDLLLITSENGKYKALSGYIQDSLGKRSQITTNFFERVFIRIPDEYFTETKILSGNRNETMFYGNGINGYGLFFLGTGIQGKYSIADRFGQELTCWGQINGYYLLNFSDFGMFPLDKNTERDYSTGGIKHIDGGLYYNCFNAEGKPYKGVYGHVVREYQNGYNSINTHEIRAGISNNGERVLESPIELMYSDNARNTERSLSGHYFSSLAKNSQVFPRFFGDLGLTDNEGNNLPATNEDIGIDYEKYLSGEISLYIKATEVPSYITKREISKDVYFIIASGNESELLKEEIETDHGFRGLKTVKFPTTSGLKQGTISTTLYDETLENSRSKTLNFHMTNTTPEITIERFPDPSVQCTTGIIFTVSANKNANLIMYAIIDNNNCNENTQFTYTYTGPVLINNDYYTNKYICFGASNDVDTGYASYQITGLDTTPPVIKNIINATGYECGGATGRIIIERGGCGNQRMEFSGGTQSGIMSQNGLEFRLGDSSNIVTGKNISFTLKDTAGNETTGEIALSWIDIPISGQNFSAYYWIERNGNNSWSNVMGSANWRINSHATAGSCESISAQIIDCDDYGTGYITGDMFNYTMIGNILLGRNPFCHIKLLDDDGEKTITANLTRCGSGCLAFEPKIVGGDHFVNRCYTGDTGNINISGTFLYDHECNTSYGLPKSTQNTQITKYTSGSKVLVQVNPSPSGTQVAEYRVSCIQDDTYCTELGSNWNDIGCNEIYSGFYEKIYGCKLGNLGCTIKKAEIRTTTCQGREDQECTCRGNSSNCYYKIPYKSCDWVDCNPTPGSGYFENILGCKRECKDVRPRRSWNYHTECNRWNGNNRCSVQRKDDMEFTLAQYTNQCNEMRNVITAGSGGFNCKQMAVARSDWIPYPGNSYTNNLIFERDLETGSGCASSGNVTINGSPYLGERTVRIQLKDKNDVLSNKTKTDIVVYDIPDYTNIENYENEGAYPLLTGGDFSDTSAGFQQKLHVEDINWLLGIVGFSGEETKPEEQINTLYQTYIKAYSPITIGKSVVSERFMKGVCYNVETRTGIFNSYISNTCECLSGSSCIGKTGNFGGLERHIPAIDNGCIQLSAKEITGVSLEELEANQNIICEGEAEYNASGDIINPRSLTGIDCTNIKFKKRERYSYSYTGQDICDLECANSRKGCYKRANDNNDKNATELTACVGDNRTEKTSNSGTICNSECQQGNCFDNNGIRIYSCEPKGTEYSQITRADPVSCNNYCSQGLCHTYSNRYGREKMDYCIGRGTPSRSEFFDTANECSTECAQGKCYNYGYDYNYWEYNGKPTDTCQSALDTDTPITFTNRDECNITCKDFDNNGNGCYNEDGRSLISWNGNVNCNSDYFLKDGLTDKLSCDQNCREGRCYQRNGYSYYYGYDYSQINSCIGEGQTQSQNFATEAACITSCSEQSGNCYDNNRNATTTQCIKSNSVTKYFTGENSELNCSTSCQNGNCYNDAGQLTGTCEIDPQQRTFDNKETCTTSCNNQNGNCYDANGYETSECIKSDMIINTYNSSNNLQTNLQNCNNALIAGNSFDGQGNTITSCQTTGNLQTTGNYTNKEQCDAACDALSGNCYNNSITPQLTGSCYRNGNIKQTDTIYTSQTQCDTACKALSGNCYDKSGNNTSTCFAVTGGTLKRSSQYTSQAQCDAACNLLDGNCINNAGQLTNSCYKYNSNNLVTSSRYSNRDTCNQNCGNRSGTCYNNEGALTGSCYKNGSYYYYKYYNPNKTSSRYSNKDTCNQNCGNMSGNCYNNEGALTDSCYKNGSYYYYKYFDDFRYNYYDGYSYKFNYYNLTFKYFKDFYFGHYDYSYNYNDYHHKSYNNIYYNRYNSFYYYEPTYYFYTRRYFYYTYPEYYAYQPNEFHYYSASGFHYDIPIYDKNGCAHTGYEYCTEYSCTKYNTGNTFECSYPICTNYGSGCLLYEMVPIETGNYIENADCTCLNVTGNAVTLSGIDANKLGCVEMTGSPGSYQCFECTKWRCNVQGECQAYSSGVTYFTTQYKKNRKASNLKLKGNDLIINDEENTGNGLVTFMHGIDWIFNYTTVVNPGEVRRRNETDINVNINFRKGNTISERNAETCNCVYLYGPENCFGCLLDGDFTLNIAPNLITDFSLNGTNGLTFEYHFSNVLTSLTRPACCNCSLPENIDCNELEYNKCGDNQTYCCLHDGVHCSYDARCIIGTGAFYTTPQKGIDGKNGAKSLYTGKIELFTNKIEINGDIVFENRFGTCPGFTFSGNTCNDNNLNYTTGNIPPAHVIIDGNEYNNTEFTDKYTLYYELSGYYNEDDEANRIQINDWTGCFIKLDRLAGGTNWLNTEIEISFHLNTGDGAFKAGEIGNETYYTIGNMRLTEAISDYGGDNGFFFYISQPQWIKIGENNSINGILGNIFYDINFSDYVADEFYRIKGDATVDGYRQYLEIKKPTQNYANPKSTSFTFPTYDNE